MIRWPHVARAAIVTLAIAGSAAIPARAQQISSEAAVAAAPAPQAPAAATAPDAGPRVNSMDRVEPRFNTPVRYFAQDDVNINRSYLIYILVAAVLVVLLVFLIKRA